MRNANQKMTYIDNASFWYDSLQNYNNYLTRHNNVNIICSQPVCRNTAPLLGGIKTNVM